YFIKLTDVHFCLLSEENLHDFDFNLQKKFSKDEEDDDDIGGEYTVNQIQHDKADFKALKGFELNLSEPINTKLNLAPGFPSATSIESCHHQSFFTCHKNELQKITKCHEHTTIASELESFILKYLKENDCSFQISSSIEFDHLISLSHALQIEKELLDSFE
ncbi:4706_t:CDS:2, partial [Gigaspora rosea]